MQLAAPPVPLEKKTVKQGLQFEYRRVLSIAGSDSSGGAGIQADLKTIAALGCYGMSAITALTAQNTQGVRAIHGVPPEMLRDQIDAVIDDLGADAVKIGMLHSLASVAVVAQSIDRHGLENVVLDPVMVATSGAVLIDHPAIAALVQQLFPRSLLITPNLDEAALLVGWPLADERAMQEAARSLIDKGARAVLLKGGHLHGEVVSDLLVIRDGPTHWMRGPRIATGNTHGTGCTLSSAIAVYLTMGKPLREACELARTYVRSALLAGADVRTGSGGGPLNHGFAPQAMQKRARIK